MRGVTCAGREIKKERFVGRLRFLIADPGDRVFYHRVIKIKVLFLRHANDVVVLSQKRIELPVFSAEKSAEIIDAERVGPPVKRSSCSLLRVGRKMPLAYGCGIIPVGLKDLRDRRRARRPIRAISGPAAD